jgi:hypothetical protein
MYIIQLIWLSIMVSGLIGGGSKKEEKKEKHM